MKTKLALLLTATSLLMACDSSNKVDISRFGDMVGGQGGHLLKAGGHMLNAASLSEKDEDAIGQSVGVAITGQYGLSQDARLQHYVMLVGLTVAAASPKPDGNWVFGVLETSEINAFSGPNGYVFVTRGAVAQMQDEAELAGVLAHEISHCIHHDGLKQVQAAEQRGALAEAMKAGNQDQQFTALADAGVDAITKQGYSQPQEFAADKSGVETMTAAGYNPGSYLHFLQRIQPLLAGNSAGKTMSTHPGIDERIKRVAQQVQTLPPGGATLADRFHANVILTSMQPPRMLPQAPQAPVYRAPTPPLR